MEKKEVIICRCNDVTEEEIVRLIREGHDNLEEIKRILRIGMGPCQGRTCIPLVIRIIARETGKPIDQIAPPTSRPPIVPVPIGVARKRAEL